MRKFIFWTICFLGTSLECFAVTTIESAELTVDGTRFYFNVVANGAGGGFNAFRIASEAHAFSGSNMERIQFNFNGATGALTTTADVNTFGTPGFDRWADGSITDLTITDLGSTNWQITGSVLHGNNPYIAGDTVSDVTIRASGEPHVRDVVVGQKGTPPTTYSVGGTVSGLTGTGLALQNNGAEILAVAAAATEFTFLTELVDSATYAVTVSTQPTGQTCNVTNDNGTIATADVTSVAVTCVTNITPTYSVGGTVTGLTGTGLALQNNGAEILAVAAAATDFTFLTELVDSAMYVVTVSTQPTGQTCSVTNDDGTIATADVTNVAVACEDDVVVVPPTPAVPVPVMSQWALIMLTMFLGLMVFANRRRLF